MLSPDLSNGEIMIWFPYLQPMGFFYLIIIHVFHMSKRESLLFVFPSANTPQGSASKAVLSWCQTTLLGEKIYQALLVIS